MIQRLRKRFIRIAMLSVALVLLALTLIVNIANFVSTNRDINEMLDLIYEGPDPGTPVEKPQTGPETGRPMLPQEPPKGPFNQETPYSMRYFTLTLDADGTVADGDFTHIASVTQQSAIAYAAAALRHGKGYGFYSSSCKFLVTAQENGQYQAIFLDCCQQLRAVRTLAVWSGVSYAVCIPRSESRSNRSGAASALRWKTNASSRRTGRWTACLIASTGRTPPAPLRPAASASASPSPRASQKPTTAPSTPACRKAASHLPQS